MGLDENFKWLADSLSFVLHGHCVEVISEPDVFFSKLKDLSSNSLRRIVLASLYLGVGQHERELVDAIAQSCSRACESNTEFNCLILLDFQRGTRGQKNSCTMLGTLLNKFPDMVNVSLFHSPCLRGLLLRLLPSRWNEIIGLQHMKIYVFDDDVLISGANLSESYFTNRQDRYILFRNCPELANYCSELVSTVSQCSFKLSDSGALVLHPACQEHPYAGSYHLFADMMRSRLDQLNNRWIEKQRSRKLPDGADTLVYPFIQAGPVGINADDIATQRVLSCSCTATKLDVASGYFNFTSEYSDILLSRNSNQLRILMASPSANGFMFGHGISGYIPAVYVHVAKLFYNSMFSFKQCHRIKLFEYTRPQWTFHAKGMWFTLPSQTLPSITMVGSPNYGYRSVHRDLELQFLISTENTLLKQQLQSEVNNLFNRSDEVDSLTFRKPDHYVPIWVRLCTRVLRHFF